MRRVSAKVKEKFYRMVVRPAMMNGLETLAIGRRQEAELEVEELKILFRCDKNGQDQERGH